MLILYVFIIEKRPKISYFLFVISFTYQVGICLHRIKLQVEIETFNKTLVYFASPYHHMTIQRHLCNWQYSKLPYSTHEAYNLVVYARQETRKQIHSQAHNFLKALITLYQSPCEILISSLSFAQYLSLLPVCLHLTNAFSALHPVFSNTLMVLY